ncbi:MAG: nucleoside-diphosphate sugar epimerase [Gammaproteobacteria bacterium]|nr:nucleoside-diphosphate sugar epimerase [Gammaproteobacteria bacterium]
MKSDRLKATANEVEAGEVDMVVWRFIDGKPGHDNQSAGLVDALRERIAVHAYDITLERRGWRAYAQRNKGAVLPNPHLLIGAGHGTHRALLRARAEHGARAVVLMRPSLHQSAFDLCVIPEHDRPRTSARTLVTRGVLNRVRPHTQARYDLEHGAKGLILLGGPSKHYDWLDAEIVRQVTHIMTAEPACSWTLCDSRRTPKGTLERLAAQEHTVIHWRDVAPGWLARQLPRASHIWVSEDSVSMVYEALTAAAAVGLLSVPRRRRGRVTDGIATLIRRGDVTPYAVWASGTALSPVAQPLAEADRCAQWIMDHWFAGALEEHWG